jgi:regulator of sigma E protease
MTYLWAIPVFLLLIGIHELGHFLGAKLVGIRVLKFAIGFGPRLFVWTRGATEYSLRLLPLGGFVLMDGMEQARPGDKRAYLNASKLARLTAIIAGPLMNLLLGFLIFVGVFAFSGGEAKYSVVDQVLPDSAAAAAGLQTGDKIVAIDGRDAQLWADLNEIIAGSGGRELDVEIQRGDETLHLKAQPRLTDTVVGERYLLGITRKLTPLPLGQAISRGWQATWGQVTSWGQALKALVEREAELSGPVGIVRAVGQGAEEGFITLLTLTAMISVQLGLFNLLPIPVLDGSHIIYIIWEAVRGRRPDPARLGMIQMAGALLLLGLFLVITYSEISKFFFQ